MSREYCLRVEMQCNLTLAQCVVVCEDQWRLRRSFHRHHPAVFYLRSGRRRKGIFSTRVDSFFVLLDFVSIKLGT